MKAIKENRKNPSVRGPKTLMRSSTADRHTPVRFDRIPDVNMTFSRVEGTNFADTITSKLRDATLSAKNTLKDREYEDMMDEHALQIFMVRNGKIIEETPEYQSFKRIAGKRWEKMIPFLKLLLKCIGDLNIKLVKINGSDLLKAALMHSRATVHHVMSCLISMDDDTNAGQNYLAALKSLSATKIQAMVRMRQAMKLTRRLRILSRKIRIIQNWIRSWLARRRFIQGKAIRDRYTWDKFEELQTRLKEEWQDIKQVNRVEIHYTGMCGSELWKLGIDHIDGRSGSQIGRVFRAMQDRVEVIYISPTEIPEEVKKYYYKMMELSGLKLGMRRVHFLNLDVFEGFPEHFSMPAKLLYSRQIIRNIRRVNYINIDR